MESFESFLWKIFSDSLGWFSLEIRVFVENRNEWNFICDGKREKFFEGFKNESNIYEISQEFSPDPYAEFILKVMRVESPNIMK